MGREEEKGIKVIFMNAQSIGNKMGELRATVAMMKPDILAVTETWANDATGNPLLGIEGYEIVARCDRNDTGGGRGGGILVYAEGSMHAWKTESPSDFNQGVTIRVKCRCEDLNIHVIYRSPNSKKENAEALIRWINNMNGINIIIGDLNFPDIEWETGTSGSRGRGFYEATSDRFFEQHVTSRNLRTSAATHWTLFWRIAKE